MYADKARTLIKQLENELYESNWSELLTKNQCVFKGITVAENTLIPIIIALEEKIQKLEEELRGHAVTRN